MGIKQKVSNSASVTDFQYKEGRNSENSAAIAADIQIMRQNPTGNFKIKNSNTLLLT